MICSAVYVQNFQDRYRCKGHNQYCMFYGIVFRLDRELGNPLNYATDPFVRAARVCMCVLETGEFILAESNFINSAKNVLLLFFLFPVSDSCRVAVCPWLMQKYQTSSTK